MRSAGITHCAAKKSIEENERDWKIYFGIDPSDSKKQPAAEQKGFWWEK